MWEARRRQASQLVRLAQPMLTKSKLESTYTVVGVPSAFSMCAS
jgi:hypothetical protein